MADDQSELRRRGDGLIVCAPATIAGLFEVRGLGILRLDALAEAPVGLVADLVAANRIERLPPRRAETILGVAVPLVEIAPFEASAVAKLRLALHTLATPPTGGKESDFPVLIRE